MKSEKVQTLCCVIGERSPMCAPHSRCQGVSLFTKADIFVKGRGWFFVAVQEEKKLLD